METNNPVVNEVVEADYGSELAAAALVEIPVTASASMDAETAQILYDDKIDTGG